MRKAGWHLNSNSGCESVSWAVLEEPQADRAQAFVCDIHLAGQYFGAKPGGESSDLRDYRLVLKGMAVGLVDLERLAAFLDSWLQLPLAEQAQNPPEIECSVGGLFDQSVIMQLGQRDDTLSGGKPVATFRSVTGRLKSELSFVTDQSCLREMSDGIRAALSGSGSVDRP